MTSHWPPYRDALLAYDRLISRPQTAEQPWDQECARLGKMWERLCIVDRNAADALQDQLYQARIGGK